MITPPHVVGGPVGPLHDGRIFAGDEVLVSSVVNHRSNAIVELMRTPAAEHDELWLKKALQHAILLELATLPPYLCGLWSIEDEDQGADAFQTIHTIAFDEMSHMGLACNMLTAIGGVPRIADAGLVPVYPGKLPGGVQPDLSVALMGLGKPALDMYSQIERPDDPVVEDLDAHTSIGAFYQAILDAFRARPELIKGTRQLTKNMASHGAGNNIVALTSLDDVEAAVKIIKEQGEGTTAAPDNPFPGGTGGARPLLRVPAAVPRAPADPRVGGSAAVRLPGRRDSDAPHPPDGNSAGRRLGEGRCSRLRRGAYEPRCLQPPLQLAAPPPGACLAGGSAGHGDAVAGPGGRADVPVAGARPGLDAHAAARREREHLRTGVPLRRG
ncbi:ferritin-like protein [Streptomyces europaeiscabiei]|uniref:ferritin-like domain-containing protein n=1 Tax=Streptomyces europaeiscabiei TaxID=146819 RepID=UPI002E199C27